MRWLGVAGIGLAVLVAAGCSTPEAEPVPDGQASGNPAAWTSTTVTAENVARAVDQLPQIVDQAMQETGVPGVAVAVVKSDEVLVAKGFGVREVGKSAAVDADTVFQLASLSKPIGATVVSRAVSQETVSWSDPVTKYLPWFELADPYVTDHVTIGDLYSHRSGLPSHAGDELEDLGFDREEILRKLAQLPLGPFRDQYAYTNFGLTAAAEAVAKANNTSWAQLSEELLYEPAGMDSTSSEYADYLSADNRAVTHQRNEDGWFPGPPRDPDAQSPAGGVSSTAKDLAKWLQLQLGDGVLGGDVLIESDAIQLMRVPAVTSGPAQEAAARSSMYGYGIGTGVDGTGNVRWSHSGAFALGAATAIDLIPGADLGIAVLTNGQPEGIAEAIAAQLVDIAETGAVQRDWLTGYSSQFQPLYENPSRLAGAERPSSPKPAAPLAEYTGTYDNSYFGPATVVESGDGLSMEIGPDRYRFPLTHWNRDVFSYLPKGENALGITAVTFRPGAGSVTVENLNEDGLGTFTK